MLVKGRQVKRRLLLAQPALRRFAVGVHAALHGLARRRRGADDAVQSPCIHQASDRILIRRPVRHREFSLRARIEIEAAKGAGILLVIQIASGRPVCTCHIVEHFQARAVEAIDVVEERAPVVQPLPNLGLPGARKPDRRPVRSHERNVLIDRRGTQVELVHQLA
jgi:hypothetical protein